MASDVEGFFRFDFEEKKPHALIPTAVRVSDIVAVVVGSSWANIHLAGGHTVKTSVENGRYLLDKLPYHVFPEEPFEEPDA